ncbi:hypothetical protein BJ322DRAFT_1112490 [Thelephora terrestris]|uniref:Uncharacterized protein n=1 Tax=Thelephora terrestris TaxID=56493 RepID=A0A9P6H6S2_9AGAM|nr:hypothetical protein BJ322DRAFT_1112490 [Thelephora terrestris]
MPPVENEAPIPAPAPASTLAESDKGNCVRCPLQPIRQLVPIKDMVVDRAEDAPRVAESPVMENNFNIDRFSHARRDRSRPYPTLGNVMDHSATADPEEGFTDLGFRDFIQASQRVSRRKLARIETNPYAEELLTHGVEFITEMNETYNSILEASVIHTSNVGTMLMDELAYVQAQVDSRKEDIAKFEEWKGTAQDILHGQEDAGSREH